MSHTLPRPSTTEHRFVWILALALGLGGLGGVHSPAHADHVLPLRLSPHPLSAGMCKGQKTKASIHIRAAAHRTLVLRRFPGQHIPHDADVARQKDYVHYITLAALTNGRVTDGAIAFDHVHAVIVDSAHPTGISRPQFIDRHPRSVRPLVNRALNTFLHLHPIFNAAIDACRPHPTKVAYETDDEVARIDAGKHTYWTLVRRHNRDPLPQTFAIPHESGCAHGYVDPEAGRDTNISYQAMNPLNFYVPNRMHSRNRAGLDNPTPAWPPTIATHVTP